MVGMVETSKQKYENKIMLWLSVIGIPLGVCIAVFQWMGLSLKLYLPISILIAFTCGVICYTILLKGDIKDKDREIITLKRKLKDKEYGKKK